MAYDRGNYKKKYFSVWIESPCGKKKQKVWTMTCEGCLDCHDHSEKKIPITVNSTDPLLTCFLQMMNLSSSVIEKRILSNRTMRITVSANSYTYDNIPNLICRMCDCHIYWNISPEDANEIIIRLDLLQYVFCVQGDPASGACLVVLEELELSCYAHHGKKQPRTTFREEYNKINQSRTVFMPPAQRDMLLSEEMKSSVEFTSILPDSQFEVVFRRETSQNAILEIKRLIKIGNLEIQIGNLEQQLKKLTSP
jgi:hypothetical protein